MREYISSKANIPEHRMKLSRIPLGHEGQPGDIAKAVLPIMSDESNYTTGAFWVVDGGYSLGIGSYQ